MKIIYDFITFSLQEYGGVSRYFTELNSFFSKKTNMQSKIIAPIHKNIHLKNNDSNFALSFYLKTYPKYAYPLIKYYNLYISNVYLRFYSPDILHQTYYSNHQYNINRKKTKLIITVYDLIHEIFYKDFGFEKDYRPKLNSLSQADYIICISKKTKQDLIEYYKIPDNKIQVIYLGTSNLKIKDFNGLKDSWGSYILFVGSRRRYKNFNNLLKAYSLSSKLSKDFKIICFGGGAFHPDEKKMLTDLNINKDKIIQINGGDDKLAYLYKHASAFIFPSIYEGFGLPILESMSNHCPVISSNHQALVEVAGDAAIYFDPTSAESILTKIEEVVYSDSLRQTLIKKGIEQSKKFTWEECANQTLKVYKKII